MLNYQKVVVWTPLKNMKVNGKDVIPYMKWNMKFMFETTSQGFLWGDEIPQKKPIEIP